MLSSGGLIGGTNHFSYVEVRASRVFGVLEGKFQLRFNHCMCLWWVHEGDSDHFWRFRCRQMAGLKSPTQTDMTRHQKPLSVVASESLSLEGPYLATIWNPSNSDVAGVFYFQTQFGILANHFRPKLFGWDLKSCRCTALAFQLPVGLCLSKRYNCSHLRQMMYKNYRNAL